MEIEFFEEEYRSSLCNKRWLLQTKICGGERWVFQEWWAKPSENTIYEAVKLIKRTEEIVKHDLKHKISKL